MCATIPMGIMQSSTTQNDYVTALWLVCLASALLAIGRPGSLPVLGAGASLGLALLTKYLALFGAAGIGLLFFVSQYQRKGLVAALRGGSVVGAWTAAPLVAFEVIKLVSLGGDGYRIHWAQFFATASALS